MEDRGCLVQLDLEFQLSWLDMSLIFSRQMTA